MLEIELMMFRTLFDFLQDSLGLSDTKFKVEFRQVEDIGGQGQKQTVAFITPTGGPSYGGKGAAKVADAASEAATDDSTSQPRLQPPPNMPTQPVFDPKLVEDFLAGEYCLNGVQSLNTLGFLMYKV